MGATIAFAAVAGAASSIGPCVAPRYLAVAAFARGSLGVRTAVLTCFAAGIVCGYAALAAAGGAVAAITRHSPMLYALLAVALTATGVASLVRVDRCCTPSVKPRSLGGITLLGMSSALVVSPCCTPALLAFAALFGSGSTTDAALCGAAFAAGHLAPLLLLLFPVRLPRLHPSAGGTVSAGVTLALGAYYGLLA